MCSVCQKKRQHTHNYPPMLGGGVAQRINSFGRVRQKAFLYPSSPSISVPSRVFFCPALHAMIKKNLRSIKCFVSMCVRTRGYRTFDSGLSYRGIRGTMKDKAETDTASEGVPTSSCLVRACVQFVWLSLHSLGNHLRSLQSTV